MSYSMSVRAATKALAIAAVAAELTKVVESQPVHQADQAQANAAAAAFINILPDDETKDVSVSMHGSLSGSWQGSTLERLTGANVSVTASLVDKLPA